MRRSLVVAATTALAASTLAFAPSVTAQQADTTHEVTFAEDGAETIEGGLPGGANVTPFLGAAEVEQSCTDSPDGYCETILLTIEQPVADEDPDAIDFGLGEVAIDLTAAVPGSDFDLYVYESDETGVRGDDVVFSANLSGCATLCGTAPDPAGLYNDCAGVDECLSFNVSTNQFSGTAHYLVEVYYFASPAGYTANLSYTRTDGRSPDGTTGTLSAAGEGEATADGGAAAPATSVERLDVTGGFEKVGDWNGGGDGSEVGSALGQDIEAAYIEYGEDVFTFTIDVTELPAAGGTPEATRYGWSFRYNDVEFELDGKFTNYSRGACDPTAGNCPPVRDPGIGYFALRGNCVTNEGNVTTCDELGGANATFDVAEATIAIPIPASLLAADGVAACDTITGTSSFIGQSVWSAPSAFVTSSASPFDDALHFLAFEVPHADADLAC